MESIRSKIVHRFKRLILKSKNAIVTISANKKPCRKEVVIIICVLIFFLKSERKNVAPVVKIPLRVINNAIYIIKNAGRPEIIGFIVNRTNNKETIEIRVPTRKNKLYFLSVIILLYQISIISASNS